MTYAITQIGHATFFSPVTKLFLDNH